MILGGGILSGCGSARAEPQVGSRRALAEPADAKVRLRRSVVKAMPSLAAARPKVESFRTKGCE
jgi:hypothetical protein